MTGSVALVDEADVADEADEADAVDEADEVVVVDLLDELDDLLLVANVDTEPPLGVEFDVPAKTMTSATATTATTTTAIAAMMTIRLLGFFGSSGVANSPAIQDWSLADNPVAITSSSIASGLFDTARHTAPHFPQNTASSDS